MNRSFKEQVDGLDHSTTQNNTFWIVEVHDRSQTISQVVCRLGDDLDGQSISLADGICKQAGTNDRLAFLQLEFRFIGQDRGTPVVYLCHDGFRDGSA